MIEDLAIDSTARVYQLSPSTLTSLQGLTNNELPSAVYAQSVKALNNQSTFSRVPEYELSKGERKAEDPMKERETIIPKAEVQVYPNPACEYANIWFHNNDFQQIMLVNTVGSVVKVMEVSSNSLVSIDVAKFSNGIYFIVGISDLGKRAIGKIAVTH
jgi:hypothetical protein